jgi:hypothetical protein
MLNGLQAVKDLAGSGTISGRSPICSAQMTRD